MKLVSRATGRPTNLASFVQQLQASGRHSFGRNEALAALGISENALKKAAGKMAAKGQLFSPRRGFFVVVPPDFQSAGAPPPSWFIGDLMAFQGQPYYVGLLSAATLHGSQHRRPREFQVVTKSPVRLAAAGKARIRFFTKRFMEGTPTIEVKTKIGSMRVSSPEATAFDLVRYAESVGHFHNVAIVLSEIAGKLSSRRLVKAAEADIEVSYVRRLGYLLDRIGAEDLSERLVEWLGDKRPRPVPLRADRESKDAPLDPRWLILVNEKIRFGE
jgi:predicted transcriptional regulator of viral defense system